MDTSRPVEVVRLSTVLQSGALGVRDGKGRGGRMFWKDAWELAGPLLGVGLSQGSRAT